MADPVRLRALQHDAPGDRWRATPACPPIDARLQPFVEALAAAIVAQMRRERAVSQPERAAA